MDRLFSVHTSDTADSSSTDQTDSADAKDSAEVKPTLLWSALYIQDLIEGSMGPVVTTPTPDGNLNHNDLVLEILSLEVYCSHSKRCTMEIILVLPACVLEICLELLMCGFNGVK
ncbi:Rab escort protein [Tanacetum coccineum]